ncbi:MAG: DUF6106 family protein [Eubacteriales bacterium]|nr:DUF6106 family protein [Eubacteriales bacterium]
MENLPVEYLIKAKPPKSALAFKIIMTAACIASALTIPSMLVWGFFLTIILVVFTVFLFRYYDMEYEYSLMAESLTIDRITSQSSRRRCGVYDISKATLVARPDSQDALRLSHQNLRNADYTSNVPENRDKAVVIHTYDENNELVRIFIEPNDALLEAIGNTAPKSAFKIEPVNVLK